jgi:hypothetical protein
LDIEFFNKTKIEWINFFRKNANRDLEDIVKNTDNYKERASEINKKIKIDRDLIIKELKEQMTEKSQNEKLLRIILMITYTSNIIMLESRNKMWEYEYMAFARRIGELWEPFCKLPFEYPLKNLEIIEPPKFADVQSKIQKNAIDYINGLDLSKEIKEELIRHFEIPWSMVDSGGIKLSLDLHFEQDNIHYNCDFKSGFSSNEKGNTNRLLLVASIYNSLGDKEKTILFVRQSEDENNHYLITLKNSPYWEVYCASDCYEAMKQFTGFDLRKWIDDNIDWENDISEDFKEHLLKNDLLKYLTW